MNKRCKHIGKDGFHRCGSYAFNLEKDDIDQGDLCDVHYWQKRALEAVNTEREACAKVCEQEQEYWGWDKVFDAATLIRARGES